MRHADRWGMLAVGAIAAAIGLAAYLAHAHDPGALWRDPFHDRNTHYRFAVDLALALRAGDVPDLLLHILQSTSWPPLHGVLLALILAWDGPEQRLAIVPSLLGWVATAVLTWAIGRRMFAGRLQGLTAASVAAALMLASPGLRLLGSDVMLEGLGSGLTAFVVYAAMCVAARPDGRNWAARPDGRTWWRLLAIGLTLLFLEKYNYWLVALAALGLSLPRPGWAVAAAWVRQIARHLRRLGWRKGFGPVGAAALLAAVLAVLVQLHGPATLAMFGRPFAVYPPGHIVSIAAALLLLQVAVFVRTWPAGAELPAAVGILLRWHVAPVAAWFLLPQMLYVFLWFVGPTHFGATRVYDPAMALRQQWTGFAGGFHPTVWLAGAVAAAAVPGWGRALLDRSGGRVVAALALLAAAAVVLHPQQQWRFQAAWLFAVWVCAGAGVAMLVGSASRRFGLPIGAGLAAAAVAVPLAAGLALPAPPLAMDVAIRRTLAPRDLDLAAAYLPLVQGASAIGFVASFGKSDLFAWTIQEQCGCRVRIDQPETAFAASRGQLVAMITEWLDTDPAERVVFIDAPAPYDIPAITLGTEYAAGVRDAMHNPPGFVLEASALAPSYPARIEVWRRTAPPPVRPRRL